MSKACEAAYTRVLAAELKDRGVMVNACCPG
jgi:NAD(P)-dependent dehydrogenase (short-subunit alcohol dehydrogenase family)